jgi:DNA polymerase III subunit epsilon
MGRSIANERFAVVDVETSGLRPQRHRLLQVGVVVVDGTGQVLDQFASLIAPARRWWFRVGPTRIHGITRRMVRDGAPIGEVLNQLTARLDGAHVVAHNAAFDVAFLQRAAQRAGIALAIDHPICTLRLSRGLDPDRLVSHRLADLCARFDVVLARPHDALADAAATAALLPHLLLAHGITDSDQLRGAA